MGKKIFFNMNVDEQTGSSVTFTRVISSQPKVKEKFELCSFCGIPVSINLKLQVSSVQLLHKLPNLPMLALRDYYHLLKMEKKLSSRHIIVIMMASMLLITLWWSKMQILQHSATAGLSV